MSNIRFSLLVIRAADIEVSAVFYRALGLELVREQHGNGPIHYASVLGETVFEIYPRKAAQQNEEAKTLMLGFKVEDLDQTILALKSAGTEVNSAPVTTAWGRSLTISDPDGYRVQITQS